MFVTYMFANFQSCKDWVRIFHPRPHQRPLAALSKKRVSVSGPEDFCWWIYIFVLYRSFVKLRWVFFVISLPKNVTHVLILRKCNQIRHGTELSSSSKTRDLVPGFQSSNKFKVRIKVYKPGKISLKDFIGKNGEKSRCLRCGMLRNCNSKPPN